MEKEPINPNMTMFGVEKHIPISVTMVAGFWHNLSIMIQELPINKAVGLLQQLTNEVMKDAEEIKKQPLENNIEPGSPQEKQS